MARKAASATETVTDEKVNKSQAVRDYLKEHPKAKGKEVVEELAKNGIEVKVGLVYLVKSALQKKKRKQKRAAAANGKPTKTVVSVSSDPLVLIKRVKDVAEEAGGIKKLRELVGILAGE